MVKSIRIAIAMVIHYFHTVLEHGLPPSLNLNHNAYSIFPRIHVRGESMARGTQEYFTLPELSECTISISSFAVLDIKLWLE